MPVVTGRRRVLIYRLAFGREVYIGATAGEVPERANGHRHRGTNARLTALLATRQRPDIKILARALTWGGAHRLEAAAIAAERRRGMIVLNKFTPGREGAELSRQRAAERHAGKDGVRCSLCRRYQPRGCFASDRSRSSGLASRCDDCRRLLHRHIQRAGSSYTAGRRLVEGWVQGGYVGDHPGLPKLLRPRGPRPGRP